MEICYLLAFPDSKPETLEPAEPIKGLKDAPYFQPKHVDLTIPGKENVECARIIFGHMSYVAVAVGNSVTPTNFLGDSGTAGTGPHLHLEVRVPDNTTSSGCRVVDPRIFFGTGAVHLLQMGNAEAKRQ